MRGLLAILFFAASTIVLVYCIHLSANGDVAQHSSAMMSMVVGSLITQTMVIVNHYFPTKSSDSPGTQSTNSPK